MRYIDINADLGEGAAHDEQVLPFVTSVNIACGFHAGGPATMRRTVDTAVRLGVALGAHPSYPDREGFGRRELEMPVSEVRDIVTYQIGALEAFARAQGARLQHVKAHGGLYHASARRPDIAEALVAAVHALDPELIVVGLPASALAAAATARGLRFAAEAFVDRGYQADGTLVPRDRPGALVEGDDATVAARAALMVAEGRVQAVDGAAVLLAPHTLCFHGDDPRVVGRAQVLRAVLEEAGLVLAPLGRWLT